MECVAQKNELKIELINIDSIQVLTEHNSKIEKMKANFVKLKENGFLVKKIETSYSILNKLSVEYELFHLLELNNSESIILGIYKKNSRIYYVLIDKSIYASSFVNDNKYSKKVIQIIDSCINNPYIIKGLLEANPEYKDEFLKSLNNQTIKKVERYQKYLKENFNLNYSITYYSEDLEANRIFENINSSIDVEIENIENKKTITFRFFEIKDKIFLISFIIFKNFYDASIDSE